MKDIFVEIPNYVYGSSYSVSQLSLGWLVGVDFSCDQRHFFLVVDIISSAKQIKIDGLCLRLVM